MSVLQRVAFTLCIVAMAGCASSAEKSSGPVASVNPSFSVDATKAAAGGAVYREKACFVCHTIATNKGGARGAAPDLSGVVERRDLEWIKKFLLDTTNMLESDPIAHALYEQYNFQKMPLMNVTEEQAENLIHYLQAETQRRRGS